RVPPPLSCWQPCRPRPATRPPPPLPVLRKGPASGGEPAGLVSSHHLIMAGATAAADRACPEDCHDPIAEPVFATLPGPPQPGRCLRPQRPPQVRLRALAAPDQQN